MRRSLCRLLPRAALAGVLATTSVTGVLAVPTSAAQTSAQQASARHGSAPPVVTRSSDSPCTATGTSTTACTVPRSVRRSHQLVTSPWRATRLFVDPTSVAALEAQRLRATDPTQAALFDRIAAQPQGEWLGDWLPAAELAGHVDARLDAAGAAQSVPVLVVYAIPLRDCGGYSAGAPTSAEAYRSWVSELARGLDGRRALVVLEPDALSLSGCLSPEQLDTRLALLSDAAHTLGAAGATVYLDAGHSAWHPPETMARLLRAAGVAHARGFALNVSNFQRTEDEVAYGGAVSRLLGGATFVVDTSRNGAGPASGPEAWCNPPDRALGRPPTGHTALPGVDALLWVKRPGESDGACAGGPSAGEWWADYAAGLSARAAW